MKRVLVTGACGNIGANVVDLLLERGYPVRAVDLDTAAGRRVATRWGDRVDLRFGSICNESVVREAVAGIDHVIHLAAMVPPGTDVDQAAGYAVNVVAMRSIIAACEAQASPPRLTFTSTAAIWGRNDEVERPRRADEAISPSDNYSRQKAECESMLRACALDTVIFRIAMT
ncbi:MAG: NAD(P)-dependent oxidoreductase, partial [Polyangiales bacterium]